MVKRLLLISIFLFPSLFSVKAQCDSTFHVIYFTPATIFIANGGSGTSSWFWDFGDSDTMSGYTVTHAFSQCGSYNVCLTISDTAGTCNTHWCDTISVWDSAPIMATVDSGNVLRLTTPLAGSGYTYQWKVDSMYDNNQNAVFNLPKDSVRYKIELKVFKNDSFNCVATSESEVCAGPCPKNLVVELNHSTGLFNYSRAYLIQKNGNMLQAIDSSDDTDSHFFANVKHGDSVFVKAALLPTDTLYAKYIPTYYSDKLRWDSATVIVVTTDTGININMLQGTNPGGSGFIGGSVLTGANKTGDPEAGIQLVLTTAAGLPVAYTYSGADGKYQFANLAFNSYKLWVDLPGKPSEVYDISLSAQTPGVQGHNFEVNSTAVKKAWPTTIVSINAVTVIIYPNPATDALYIDFNAAANETELKVTDLSGRILLKQAIPAGFEGAFRCDVGMLSPGFYMLQLATQVGESKTVRFIKK